MKNRFLTVPLNEKGKEDYDFGVEGGENTYECIMPEEEFSALDYSGILDRVSEMYRLDISEYESEIVGVDAAETMLQLIDENKVNVPTAKRALEMAIEKGTFIAFDL